MTVLKIARAESAPSLAEVAAGLGTADRTCGRCGRVCASAMPSLEGGALVLLDAERGLHDMLAVQVAGRWCVRPVEPLEQGLPFWDRRQSHTCRRYPELCQTPGHEGRPALKYAGGRFCDPCAAPIVQLAV